MNQTQSQQLKLTDEEIALLFEIVRKTQVPMELEKTYQSLRSKIFDDIKMIQADEKIQGALKPSRNGKK